LEELVSLSFNVCKNKFFNPLTIIVETAVLYNFLRRRNYRIEDEPLQDADENHVPAIIDLVHPLDDKIGKVEEDRAAVRV
jgi:hypothetical protein